MMMRKAIKMMNTKSIMPAIKHKIEETKMEDTVNSKTRPFGIRV